MAKGTRGRWLLAALGGVALLGSLAFGAWLALPGFVWRTVQREADVFGVRLRSCKLELHLSALELSACEFALNRFPEVRGTLEHVEVALSGLRPERVTVSGARVSVEGLPRLQDLAQQIEPAGSALPFELQESELAWRAEAQSAPWLVLSQLAYQSANAKFSADAQLFAGRFRGTLGGSAGAAQLRMVAADNAASDLAFSLTQSPDVVELVIEAHKLPLAHLEGAWLKLSRELAHVETDGRLHVLIPVGLTAEVPSGDLRFVLTGLNFPVPRELAGLVYGTPAQLSSSLTFARNLERADLERTSFSVGTLTMRGRGRVQLENTGLGFQLNLSGDLGCDAIARSAATAHVGSELGKAAGRIAKKALQGSVQIGAVLSGNSSDLEQASVVSSVGIGCGFRPLPLDSMMKAPLELLQQLSKLPGMPAADGAARGAAPNLLPDLDWPKLNAPRDKRLATPAPVEPEAAGGNPHTPAVSPHVK